MIIVSGQIYLDESDREAFLARSLDAVAQARRVPGCLDFVVAADPLESNRVNIYERWQSESALEAFRGGGPGPDIESLIVSAEVARYQIASSGPA